MNNTPNTGLKTFSQQLYNNLPAQNVNLQNTNTVNNNVVDNKTTSKGDFITIKGKKLDKTSVISGIAGIIMIIAGIILATRGKGEKLN